MFSSVRHREKQINRNTYNNNNKNSKQTNKKKLGVRNE
jgi:hypothetical protein